MAVNKHTSLSDDLTRTLAHGRSSRRVSFRKRLLNRNIRWCANASHGPNLLRLRTRAAAGNRRADRPVPRVPVLGVTGSVRLPVG